MRSATRLWSVRFGLLSSLIALGLLTAANADKQNGHRTSKFEGPKANAGYATHSKQGSVKVLTFSDEAGASALASGNSLVSEGLEVLGSSPSLAIVMNIQVGPTNSRASHA